MVRQKLLIIAYLFPPAGGIAVQRALSLAKYLPDLGYEVHVLKARSMGPAPDPGLLKHVPPAITVHEAFAPEIPFRLRQRLWSTLSRGGKATRKRRFSPRAMAVRLAKRIFCPEPEILWTPFALRAARKIIREHAIGTVLITAPPFSSFVIGCVLKRDFPEVALVSDFRDEWLSFYLKDFEFQSDPYTRRRAEAIERGIVQASNRVVAVNPSSLNEIRNRYPEEPGAKFVCVPNGYDPEVFACFKPRPHRGNRVVVTHMGTAYNTASPRYYLDALDEMPEAVRTQVETRFIGRVSDGERAILEGRKSAVRVLGFMPQSEALRMVEETDYLLLTMTNDISVPGKLFEYMATGKPILALSPRRGEVQRVLAETRAGWCVEPGDRAGIQAMLQRACQGSNGFAPDREAIRRYERPRLAAEYAAVIESIS
ncbi:MAG: glycosyltransferase [Acidobacteria bacterium]|nr:glycosyltransferase [Acidobacteriota bacterium]